MSNFKRSKCTSCGNTIQPGEDAVNFPCPKCGDVLIWRCENCRRFARAYRCPKCNFEGP